MKIPKLPAISVPNMLKIILVLVIINFVMTIMCFRRTSAEHFDESPCGNICASLGMKDDLACHSSKKYARALCKCCEANDYQGPACKGLSPNMCMQSARDISEYTSDEYLDTEGNEGVNARIVNYDVINRKGSKNQYLG